MQREKGRCGSHLSDQEGLVLVELLDEERREDAVEMLSPRSLSMLVRETGK
jgi:hypothetical protein